MASKTEICNRALQKLGALSVTNVETDNTKSARECNRAFAALRDAELRAHVWNFATARASLAALSAAPAWEFAFAYQLPADWLRMVEVQGCPPATYRITGRAIETDLSAPLAIRYVRQVTDTGQFDALFGEALASRMAMELCETITESNTKKEAAAKDYRRAMAEAAATDAVEGMPDDLPEDPWILARL